MISATRENEVYGTLRTNQSTKYVTMNIIVSDEQLKDNLKITIWGGKILEFQALKLMYYDLVKFEGVELIRKDVNDAYNWGTVPYVGNVSDNPNSKMMKMVTMFDYGKLEFGSLDGLQSYNWHLVVHSLVQF